MTTPADAQQVNTNTVNHLKVRQWVERSIFIIYKNWYDDLKFGCETEMK